MNPLPEVVDKMENDFQYRFLVLRRNSDKMYLVATKGDENIFIELMLSPELYVFEKYSVANTSDYAIFLYNNSHWRPQKPWIKKTIWQKAEPIQDYTENT